LKVRRFKNRDEAATKLAEILAPWSGEPPLVIGFPKAGIPMARTVAHAIGGDLDILLVRKIPHPLQPELTLAAVTEDGNVFLNPDVAVPTELVRYIESEALAIVRGFQDKRLKYTGGHYVIDVDDRDVVLVDDGVATGTTVLAAAKQLREKGARSITIAAPVVSADAARRLAQEGIVVRAVVQPEQFGAVEYYYDDFDLDSEAEPSPTFHVESRTIKVEHGANILSAITAVPRRPIGVVVFAHGSGSGRFSPRNQFVADVLNRRNIATVLADLLTEDETLDRGNVFDIELLARRVLELTEWAANDEKLGGLPIGYFGASTGAGAALKAAARSARPVHAVVSRGGRPDLAKGDLRVVASPTLLIVGGEDGVVIDLNKEALAEIPGQKRMAIVNGAGHLFSEPGALEEVSELAADWFESHFLALREAVPAPGLRVGEKPAKASKRLRS
jgi:predicted phosphoribosyltransferase/dienelactone hydrolase